MANFKIDFLYTQPDRSWHEIYYRSAADIGTAATIPGSVLNALVVFRHPLTVLRKVTATDVLTTRVSVIKPLNRQGQRDIAEGHPDIIGTSARIKLSSSSIGASRSVWLRGLEDGDVYRSSASGVDTPSGFLVSSINALITQLASYGFLCRGVIPSSAAFYHWSPVTGIQVLRQGSVILKVAVGPVAAVGEYIQVAQFDTKDWPGLNGRYLVLAADTGSVTIGYNAHRDIGSYDVKKGRLRRSEYRYGGITPSISGFAGFTSRKTGGSPLVGRGRRSTGLRRSA